MFHTNFSKKVTILIINIIQLVINDGKPLLSYSAYYIFSTHSSITWWCDCKQKGDADAYLCDCSWRPPVLLMRPWCTFLTVGWQVWISTNVRITLYDLSDLTAEERALYTNPYSPLWRLHVYQLSSHMERMTVQVSSCSFYQLLVTQLGRLWCVAFRV